MPNAWRVDIGFDWDAEPNGGYDGRLQAGVLSSADNKPAGVMQLNAHDTINFYVYDVSGLNDGKPGPANSAVGIPAGWLQARPGSTNTHPEASPFSATTLHDISVARLEPSSNDNGKSGYFGGPWPVWQVNDAKGNLLTVVVEHTDENPASFYITYQLNVIAGGVAKLFGVDPEMIVKP
jgi:hypothetical protein